jgi:hypothetical protein
MDVSHITSLNNNTEVNEEHRWSERKPADFPVKVYRNGQFVADSVINDISLEGIFFDNNVRGNEQTIFPNTYIEVEFDLASNKESIHYRLPALVRHRSDEGVGAMFLHFSTGTFRHFHRILYQEPGQQTNSKSMKSRWSPRKNINLNLSLYQSGEKITDASTSNLSYEGVFIKTTLSPPLYSFLTVEFSLEGDENNQTLKVPCLVRHRSNSGIGLMFVNFQLDMFNRLRHGLYDNNIKPGLNNDTDTTIATEDSLMTLDKPEPSETKRPH